MENTRDVINAIGEAIIANKEYLTELDSPIGDSDHGMNLARGFEAAREKMEGLPADDVAGTIKKAGMTLLSTVGGASGALYATAFLRAAAAVGDAKAVDSATALAMFEAAIKGIQERGKATTGEKTMLDALIPAYEAMKAEVDAGKSMAEGFDAAVKAAEEGVEYTKTIIATKGRASYLGERSIGHQDPGATSSTIVLQVLDKIAHEQGV